MTSAKPAIWRRSYPRSSNSCRPRGKPGTGPCPRPPAHESAAGDRFEARGETGLSWGSFYTMLVTAVSPFIKAAAPSAFVKDYDDIVAGAKDGEARSPDRDVVGGLSHAQSIPLICPRPTFVQMGENDPVGSIAGRRKKSERAAVFLSEIKTRRPLRISGPRRRTRLRHECNSEFLRPPAAAKRLFPSVVSGIRANSIVVVVRDAVPCICRGLGAGTGGGPNAEVFLRAHSPTLALGGAENEAFG